MQYRFKSDSDRWSMANHLRVAAERYDGHAEEFEKMPGEYKRLAEQFRFQAKQARTMADDIEALEA